MNRTLLDECFRVEGRKTWYENTEQLQVDLDRVPRVLQPTPHAPGLPSQGPDADRRALRGAAASRRTSFPPGDPPQPTDDSAGKEAA